MQPLLLCTHLRTVHFKRLCPSNICEWDQNRNVQHQKCLMEWSLTWYERGMTASQSFCGAMPTRARQVAPTKHCQRDRWPPSKCSAVWRYFYLCISIGVCVRLVPVEIWRSVRDRSETMKGATSILALLLISVSGQVLMLGQAQEWAYEVGKAITAGM